MSKKSSDYNVLIEPKRTFSLNLSELWEFRELFYFFTWRDIKVKYKQTLLGFVWAVLQPLLMITVFTFIFNKKLNISAPDGVPYPVYVFSGLLIWSVFANGLSNAGNSMISNANIIKKIYFPRLIIPFSAILAASFDFLISFAVYICVLFYYSYTPPIEKMLVLMPLSIFLAMISTVGLGCIVSAVNIKYRDFKYVLPFGIQLLFFLSPVLYTLSGQESTFYLIVLALNPMFGVIELSHAALINGSLNFMAIGISVGMSFLLFFVGLFYFKRTESYFADVA